MFQFFFLFFFGPATFVQKLWYNFEDKAAKTSSLNQMVYKLFVLLESGAACSAVAKIAFLIGATQSVVFQTDFLRSDF